MKGMRLYWILMCVALGGCSNLGEQGQTPNSAVPAAAAENAENAETALATFAGGCFWCMEAPFEKLDGVHSVVSGYTGGHVENPTYEQVCSGTTGHLEAIQVAYDPTKLTYEKLLDVFWRQIDPTDAGGSFVDRGPQYASGIFYHDERQKASAEVSKAALGKSKRFADPVVTEIRPLPVFYPAEDYHQDYYKKSTAHYKAYREGSGRDQFIARAWADAPAE